MTALTTFFDIKEKKYLTFVFLFLSAGLTFSLIQIGIRYGMPSGEQFTRTFTYLAVAIVLFLPLIPLVIRVANKYVCNKHYWVMSIGVGITTICLFYLISGLSMYAVGFFDSLDIVYQYTRNYFGRLVGWHILTLISAFMYVKYKPSPIQVPMISGTKGRKKITLPAHSIHWVEADDHYVKLHGTDVTLLKRATLKEIVDQFDSVFVRVHRKYLVNQNEILGREKQSRDEFIILKSGEKVKIGRSYLDSISID